MTHMLLVVDVNRDFFDLPGSRLPIQGSRDIIPVIRDYLATTTAELVVFTSDSHDESHVEYAPDGTAFPQHCVRGTDGEVLVADHRDLPAGIPAFRLEKNVFDMWEEDNTFLTNYADEYWTQSRDEFFADVKKRGITEVKVIGVAADFCVNFAIKGLVERGFNVTVIRSCTKGLFREIDDVVKGMENVNVQ